jgi:SAM-dependent methyltransferase
VLASELDPELRRAISDRISAEGLRNVTVVTSSEDGPGLSPGCCDAIVLRGVYHHLTRPESMLAGIVKALKPGGRLVVVDFAPTALLAAYSSSTLRRGHGVERQTVLNEVGRAGLEAVSSIEPYPGLWPLPAYGLVFRKAVAP